MASKPMSNAWPCVRGTATGVVLDISVVPGASRTELVGLHDGALRVRLAAPAVEGKANAALLAWLTDELGIARREAHLLRGTTARRKQVALNVPLEQMLRWLDAELAR